MAKDLSGKRLLITSGPTRAKIDAVRYISNRSSGLLGCRIAVEALGSGARVTLVAGPESAVPQREDLPDAEWGRLRVVPIETVFELLQVLQKELTASERYDAVVHAMAVLDYVPQHTEPEKVPSGKESWTLRLVRTPKVIRQIKVWSPRSLLVGFKLEAGKDDEALRDSALALRRLSRADLVVANDLSRIRDETHPALIIGTGGAVLARPQTKTEIASQLCRLIAEWL